MDPPLVPGQTINRMWADRGLHSGRWHTWFRTRSGPWHSTSRKQLSDISLLRRSFPERLARRGRPRLSGRPRRRYQALRAATHSTTSPSFGRAPVSLRSSRVHGAHAARSLLVRSLLSRSLSAPERQAPEKQPPERVPESRGSPRAQTLVPRRQLGGLSWDEHLRSPTGPRELLLTEPSPAAAPHRAWEPQLSPGTAVFYLPPRRDSLCRSTRRLRPGLQAAPPAARLGVRLSWVARAQRTNPNRSRPYPAMGPGCAADSGWTDLCWAD